MARIIGCFCTKVRKPPRGHMARRGRADGRKINHVTFASQLSGFQRGRHASDGESCSNFGKHRVTRTDGVRSLQVVSSLKGRHDIKLVKDAVAVPIAFAERR